MEINRCKDCGANLAMVGVRHRCIPSSGWTDEAKARDASEAVGAIKRTPPIPRAAGVGSERSNSGGEASGGRRGKTRIPQEGATALKSVSIPAPPEAKPQFRKPLAKDAHKTLMATKPWDAEGLSRRTWYRRQKEQK